MSIKDYILFIYFIHKIINSIIRCRFVSRMSRHLRSTSSPALFYFPLRQSFGNRNIFAISSLRLDQYRQPRSRKLPSPCRNRIVKMASNKRAHADAGINKDNDESSKRTRKFDGAAKYSASYNPEWAKTYPVRAVANNKKMFHCIPCNKNIHCSHMGVRDIVLHCGRDVHKANVEKMKNQASLNSFVRKPSESSLEKKTLKAEVMVTNFLVQHNLPIATADHLGPLFKAIFPDSQIASKYAAARTKTTAILNIAMGPHCHQSLVEHCQSHPFTLGTDGSNDSGLLKMNPVTIRLFDVKKSKKVTNHFFDICTTTGEDCGKAYAIFDAINSKFDEDSVPWSNAVSLSVDNTNAMIGIRNSVASRCKEKNPSIFIAGCPCHLAHLVASEANDAFTEVSGMNIESIVVDLFYWFDKSSKRKGKLSTYFEFCDQEYQQVLKHISVRWLSLERCVDRALKKLPSLKSYFLSEHAADERFERLRDAFSNPLLEPILQFHSASIGLFTNFNKLLQRDEPTIHILLDAMNSLAKKLASRIVLPNIIKDNAITDIDLDDDEVFKSNQHIFLGGMTKNNLSKLLNDGDIGQSDYDKVFHAAHQYFKHALVYMQQKFPLTDEVLMNARWIDVSKRMAGSWENVEYFVQRYSILCGISHDELYDEYFDYQTLNDNEIGEQAWEDAKVIDCEEEGVPSEFHYRVDVLWWYIANMKMPETNVPRFRHLLKVAEVVLVLPHSNAEEERLFSIVRKNKTDSRSSMKLSGTLSSILAMKSSFPESSTPCSQWQPDDSLLKKAKSATVQYNAAHKS